MTDQKPTNPKDAVGSGKIPLHLWPETATVLGSMGLLDGMLKYGRGNYRAIGVRASIYVDACKRHLNAWFEGEDTDPDSGLPHLAHALACLAILVDAQAADQLTDDRQIAGGYRKLVEEMTPHVQRMKDLHADKDPQHFTIGDGKETKVNDKVEVFDDEGFGRDISEHTRRGTLPVVEPGLLGQDVPIWRQPHYPSWHLGGGVMSAVSASEHVMTEDEIAEACRLAQSGTVMLPIGLRSPDEEDDAKNA